MQTGIMRASAALMVASACAALSLLSPVQSLDYYTGQTSRRRLQQGPGGGTCQNGPRSAQYRCMALTSRSSGYQFCARLCQTGLGGRNGDNADNESPPPSRMGSAANGGNNTRLETAGGLGGSTLGSTAMGGVSSCTPCVDVQQQCQQGESAAGGLSQAYYRAYVNRYFSGIGCQDVGPSVAVGGSNTSPSPSPSSFPSPSYSPSPGYLPYGSGGR